MGRGTDVLQASLAQGLWDGLPVRPFGSRLLYLTFPPFRGQDVLVLQTVLERAGGLFPGEPDGIFGRRTRGAVVRLQRRYGLPEDGAVGVETWRVLGHAVGAAWRGGPSYGSRPVTRGMRGPDVTVLQHRLNLMGCLGGATANGWFDPPTRRALAEYLRRRGIEGTGEATVLVLASVYLDCPAGGRSLLPGTCGLDVACLQRVLAQITAHKGLPADGQFGPATERAVAEVYDRTGITRRTELDGLFFGAVGSLLHGASAANS